MGAMKIAGSDAWKAAVKNPAGRWHEHIGRFSRDIVEVSQTAKFAIAPDDRFFCIGSCFARNIEEHLIYRGVDVLSRKIICPKEEWPNRVNGFVNKFTTQSMHNEIRWVLERPTIDAELFSEQESGWIDLQLCPGTAPVSLDRAMERRAYLTDDYFDRIRKASVVVLTLGLNEVWFDRAIGRHLNAPPSYFATRREPERYELHITDVEENVVELSAIRALLMTLNPDVKMIVTVSPVPMSDTFSGKDILLANTYSKSTLRCAAEIFSSSHDNVGYFPSYDIISLSPRSAVYGADCLHVSDAVVGRMMQTFLHLYLGIEPQPAPFNELAYLEANPDVEAALRRGELESGFQHWTQTGRQEGRPLAPADGPTALMIAAGAV
jgi:hypothetical protein